MKGTVHPRRISLVPYLSENQPGESIKLAFILNTGEESRKGVCMRDATEGLQRVGATGAFRSTP